MQSLVFHGLTKAYGGVVALDGVSLTLAPGAVHAVMGENGAGKSTLIKLIAGVVRADAGHAEKDGTRLSLSSPADAVAAGFRVIHQELAIIPQVSVAENILLGHSVPRRMGVLVDWHALHARARAALADLGAGHIDTTAMAGDLGRGDRMLVRIATALVAGSGPGSGGDACLYVLDEPTAALSPAESGLLFAVIARLKARGAAVLYVSHRMDEVMRLCDDITVLRDGRLVSTGRVAGTTKAEVIHAMTGRLVADAYPPRLGHIGKDVLRADALCTPALHDLTFSLRKGEILGLTGLGEAGQRAVLRAVLGVERVRAGTLTYHGHPAPTSAAAAWAAGIALIPGERRAEALAMERSVCDNAVLPHLRRWIARPRADARETRSLAARVGLKATGVDQPVGQLSGGNQQKVVFARALMGNPRLLLLEDPTRGVDVGARAEIYGLIRAASARGCAVLIASTDLAEVSGLCDRVMVLAGGRQVQMLDPAPPPARLLDLIQKTAMKGAAC